ncbi:hypothetical protein RRG08_056519 [Elysia crispata]|uniref:Uncharacterized protein n=1 Tax=Elysia crispata TaxID=231223 RepID=A0AAE1CRE3_9GAST|nr:hypothetical protein RRG08_056519 [Elysia crispata]
MKHRASKGILLAQVENAVREVVTGGSASDFTAAVCSVKYTRWLFTRCTASERLVVNVHASTSERFSVGLCAANVAGIHKALDLIAFTVSFNLKSSLICALG